ncbi:MAG: hypothetical protein ACFFAS_08250 [Promethearchaeota archaeon]
MMSNRGKRNELYVFNEKDSAYKVIKSIMLDFFITGFQSSNYIMNGQFSPESEEESDFVLQSLKNDFEDYFAEKLNTIIQEITTRAEHIAKLDLKKIYYKKIQEVYTLKKINKGKSSEKILTICPKCQKKIKTIDFDMSNITRFPFSYVNVHAYGECQRHGLLMYIDAQGRCRGKGNIDFYIEEDD